MSYLFVLARKLYLDISLEASQEVGVDGVPQDTGTAVGCLDLKERGGREKGRERRRREGEERPDEKNIERRKYFVVIVVLAIVFIVMCCVHSHGNWEHYTRHLD